MTSVDQLERNVRAASAPFDEADRQILAMELNHIGPYYCRMCQTCEGTCQNGLPVSDLQRFLLYADGYGDWRAAYTGFHQLPARLQEVRCSKCPACTVRCPNGVRVRERITRAQTLLA
jgi:ferredoxin